MDRVQNGKKKQSGIIFDHTYGYIFKTKLLWKMDTGGTDPKTTALTTLGLSIGAKEWYSYNLKERIYI